MSDRAAPFSVLPADSDLLAAWPPSPERLTPAFSGYEADALVSHDSRFAVYQGIQTNLNRRVVICVLSPAISLDPDIAIRFRQQVVASSDGTGRGAAVHDFGSVQICDSTDCLFVVTDRRIDTADFLPTSSTRKPRWRLLILIVCVVFTIGLVAALTHFSQPPIVSVIPSNDSPAAKNSQVLGDETNTFESPDDLLTVPKIPALIYRNEQVTADFVVTTLEDGSAVVGSLREALNNAVPGQRVTFAPWLDGGTLVLTGGPLNFPTSVSIDGSGLSERLRIDADGKSRVFYVDGNVRVALINLWITGGQANTGAGVWVKDGELELRNCAIENCHAKSFGGGIFGRECYVKLEGCCICANTTKTSGGGVANFGGTFLMTNCIIAGNSSPERSGASMNVNFGTTKFLHCTVAGNEGGGIESDWRATLLLESTIVWGNVGKHGDLQVWRREGGPGLNTVGVNIVGDLQAEVKTGPEPRRGDPLLVPSEAGGRLRLFSLQPDSPAIDAAELTEATPAIDFFGKSRSIDGDGDTIASPDLGAVEFD